MPSQVFEESSLTQDASLFGLNASAAVAASQATERAKVSKARRDAAGGGSQSQTQVTVFIKWYSFFVFILFGVRNTKPHGCCLSRKLQVKGFYIFEVLTYFIFPRVSTECWGLSVVYTC